LALRSFIYDNNGIFNKKAVMAAHNRSAILGKDDPGLVGERTTLTPGGTFLAADQRRSFPRLQRRRIATGHQQDKTRDEENK
jgi:hypothetical protein